MLLNYSLVKKLAFCGLFLLWGIFPQTPNEQEIYIGQMKLSRYQFEDCINRAISEEVKIYRHHIISRTIVFPYNKKFYSAEYLSNNNGVIWDDFYECIEVKP